MFQWCSALTSVTVPQSVTEIGEYAFSNCTALTSLSLPSRLESLGSMAFEGCTALTSAVIPDSVTEMGSMAFYGCSELRAITFSAGLTEIDADMFGGCTKLSEITVAKGNPVYHSVGNCLIETRAKALVLGCQASVIPTDGSVTRICDSAFDGCSGLRSLLIPAAVEKIDPWAFGDCPGLSQITVEAGHPVYHSAGNCLIETQSKTLVLGCQTGVIPTDGSVTSIAHSAFRGCSTLTSIVIPNGVERIGGSAFDYCSGLASVIISSDLTEIGSHAFNECSNLTSIVFNGTRAEWNAVIKGEGWNYRIPAAGVLCSDGMAYFE